MGAMPGLDSPSAAAMTVIPVSAAVLATSAIAGYFTRKKAENNFEGSIEETAHNEISEKLNPQKQEQRANVYKELETIQDKLKQAPDQIKVLQSLTKKDKNLKKAVEDYKRKMEKKKSNTLTV